MSRIIEIEVILRAEDDPSESEYTARCGIDLDCVECCHWSPRYHHLVILFRSGNHHTTNQFTFDEFMAIWKGVTTIDTKVKNEQVEIIGTTHGDIEPCSMCGSIKITQCGNTMKCHNCSFSWLVK